MARDSQAAAGTTASARPAVTAPMPPQSPTTQPTSQSTAPASAAVAKNAAGKAATNGAMVDGVRYFDPRDSRIEKATDLGSVQDLVMRVGALVTAHPAVAELDLNPVIATPTGVVAVDALVVLEDAAS